MSDFNDTPSILVPIFFFNAWSLCTAHNRPSSPSQGMQGSSVVKIPICHASSCTTELDGLHSLRFVSQGKRLLRWLSCREPFHSAKARQGRTLCHCDDALLAHALHGARYELADFLLAVCADRAHLRRIVSQSQELLSLSMVQGVRIRALHGLLG